MSIPKALTYNEFKIGYVKAFYHISFSPIFPRQTLFLHTTERKPYFFSHNTEANSHSKFLFRRHTPQHASSNNQLGLSRPPRIHRGPSISFVQIINSPELTIITAPHSYTDTPFDVDPNLPCSLTKRRNSSPDEGNRKHEITVTRAKSEEDLTKENNGTITPNIPPSVQHKWDDPITSCVICTDVLCPSSICTKSHIHELPCTHRFHTSCLLGRKRWIPRNPTCPLCRKSIYETPPGLLRVQETLARNQRPTSNRHINTLLPFEF